MSSTPTFTTTKTGLTRAFLPQTFVPHATDVLIGRGRRVVNHPGNKKFRGLVNSNLAAYSLAETKSKKSNIIISIFQALKTASDETTGFVKMHNASKRWFMIDDANARISIAQAFRDALSFEYKSSKSYKQQKRQEERGEFGSPSMAMSGLSAMLNMNRAQGQQQQQLLQLPQNSLLAPPPLVAQVSVDRSSFLHQGNNSRRAMQLQEILDTANHVVDDDMFVFSQHGSLFSAPAQQQQQQQQGSGDVFSSLFSAFGTVNSAVDPFEPTPMAEKTSVLDLQLPFDTSSMPALRLSSV